MKKGILKSIVFAAVFVVTLFAGVRLMNQGHDNLTVEMAKASLPIVTMQLNGTAYNQLHGYTEAVDVAFLRDNVTVLGEGRDTGFFIDTYGENVTEISIEVRNRDGSRLIENTPVTEYTKAGNRINGTIALKDLIERDTEYSLAVILTLDGGRQVSYYTRVIWSEKLHTEEKLAFVSDFHDRLYDREAARELTKYLETNSALDDNSSFHKVTIHSSFRQITWGELDVTETVAPVWHLKEIAGQTASFLADYIVETTDEQGTTYYLAEEYYRIRYTADRMYLLDYERTMEQIPDVEKMYGNDKILLGITDADVDMCESEDGNIIVFEAADRLFSYDVTTNKLVLLFGYYDADNADARTLYDRHAIRILDVDEGGNVQFAVYGYLNRGRHEGQVGIQIYTYSSSLNTVEELVYIPSDKTYTALAAELEQLLYLNRDGRLYLKLNDTVYRVNLADRTYTKLIEIVQEEGLRVSADNKIAVWAEGEDVYHSTVLHIRNLNVDEKSTISAKTGEAILPLGFMDEDIIYGVAREEDIVEERSGRIFFPMYKVCICDFTGELLKEYYREDVYVTGCTVEDNQIILDRVIRQENGTYQTAAQDHIMNNAETAEGKNVVVTADIERYERYVQIKTRAEIDTKTLKVLNPKEIVFEGGRVLALTDDREVQKYYVYDAYGIDGIYFSPAEAVRRAYAISGVVVNERGECVWLKGNRVARNQIMAIKAAETTEEKDSLAVCLDTIFAFEGLVRNSEYLLAQGQSVSEALQDNLENVRVMDLTGCSLDAMLYYVNQDLPVLALLENGEAVLITGFNEYNVVIMEPSTGRLYKKGMNDSTEWFAENGNCFITYVREEN